ncbi:hypothetical protein DL768_009433 [Monosporascus sp. mg162]|nr:hypothetical protein DL768_009433 [Monosporascus sp. mg162]
MQGLETRLARSIFSSSSFVSPLAQNRSCDPFTPKESECRLGNYPAYVVNASTADDVSAAVHFARLHNVRLIIKSTGHDLLGRSSGAASLSIWMHFFRNLTIIESYSGANSFDNYHGPAVSIGPGLLAYEVFEAAQKQGLRVLGGTCPTVGIGGGYTSGGGHSLLSSKYGLSADNVLEWDVITASGHRVTATPSQNPDLYWALSGGGTGVFAVILGVTVKAFPDGIVSAAGITFNITSSPSGDAFWSAMEALHSSTPAWLDQNATAAYVLAGGTLSLQPLTLPDQSADAVRALIEPFLATLATLNIPYTLNITTFPSFLDLYSVYYGPLPYGLPSSSVIQTSRLLPRSVLTSEKERCALMDAQRHIASLAGGSFWIVGTALALPHTPSAAPSNAVLPAWRDASVHQMIVGQWDWNATWTTNLLKQETLLSDVLPALVNLSPGSGTYMSEGNPAQADWKEAFYGENYERLLDIKKKWDPEGVFFAHAGVGSHGWRIDEEGRLCTLPGV